MSGAVHILRRFISATILIAAFLLILNYVFLGAWVFNGMNASKSPMDVVRATSGELHRTSGSYALGAKAEKLLMQHSAWAMLVDNTGQVAWDYALPDELPRLYSLTDVAKLSRHYIMDYPVFIWEHVDGLVVVGYPKDSLAKYQFSFPVDWISDVPFRLVGMIIGNIALALLLSLMIGTRLIKAIAPLIDGIHGLAHEQPAHVEPKGLLRSLAKSINHTSALLQEKNTKLKARDEARSNWIAGISHDIRTPLSMVLGYASQLEESESILAEQRKKAAIIRRQGEKLRSLVSDLNLVSMLEYEMQPVSWKAVRMSVLARQAVSEFLNNNDVDERFTLELDVQEENIRVNGDEKLLLRAISNLVQNCMIHNREGCRIRLQIMRSPDKKACRFIVSDNGKGIPQGELADLLEPPYSSQRKRPARSGHGLGLPMVARIAKAHQGRLILTSDTGKGLRAKIELPAMAEA
ncbi:sensor histidine kinase [Brevibacillus borstelensis]|uniref:sensor histidine kinase n=1 Tax=Brevibacillus borstelensis TaxID=45462 RepID=UPI0030BE3C28